MRTSTLLVRLLVTGLAVALAVVVGWQLWDYYMREPWTRDGRVRADVVQVAPDVSGLVTSVDVSDNQLVKKGQPLFSIDRERFALALQQADAVVENRRVTMEQAARDASRLLQLNTIAVPQTQREQAQAQADAAAAAYRQALADRGLAQLNLDRSRVAAPVNGYVTNLGLRPGDYVSAGKPVLALVDSDSFYVVGYFEETKLPRIHVGDVAAVQLMGVGEAIGGHVQGVARGIVDREQSDSPNLLANVNPTFSWVRLAQRIPVRIALDRVPDPRDLVAGRTATVVVTPGTSGAAPVASGAAAGQAGPS
jgi:multidrug resistance efflux pump